MAVIQQTKKT